MIRERPSTFYARLSGRELDEVLFAEEATKRAAAIFVRLGAELEAERKLALHLSTRLPRRT